MSDTDEPLEEVLSNPEIEEETDTELSTDIHPIEEKKPEGIEHDPYEWGKCALTASIAWLPDGSVLLGVRSHLDAPIITVLTGDALIHLPGHAAELPLPTLETLADLLAQLREDLPLRARAKAERDEAAHKKAQEAKTRHVSAKKNTHAVTPQHEEKKTNPAKMSAPAKTPSATQASLFSMMTGDK